jgi:hypothetical protein
MEALDQFKQRGFVEKLKTNITPNLMYSAYQDFVEFLHNQVTGIDGMCFIHS